VDDGLMSFWEIVLCCLLVYMLRRQVLSMLLVALLVMLLLVGCAAAPVHPVPPQYQDVLAPYCHQGVDSRGMCRDGTGTLTYLGLETMIDVGG
jgi:hypothetical protein